MASSPGPKRRRTSPEESSNWVDASADTNLPNSRSSPSRQSRASYLSPTKASISRHNPSLLPRPIGAGARSAASKGKPLPKPARSGSVPLSGRVKTSEPVARASVERDQDTRSETLNALGVAKPSGIETPTLSARRDGRPVVSGGMSAAPRRRSRTPGAQSTPSKASQPKGDFSGFAPQDDVPNLGTEAANAREEDIEPEAEPELPPTPSQLGLPDPVANRLPAGLSSSPSRRARKKKHLGEKPKPSPLRPTQNPPGPNTEISRTHHNVDLGSEQSEPQTQVDKSLTLRNGKQRRTGQKVGEDGMDAALALKRRLKEQLLAQLNELQEEVSRLEAEVHNETQAAEQVVEKPSPKQLLYVLIHPKDYSAPPLPPPKPKPPLSLTLSTFLPFSKRLVSLPRKQPPPPSGPIPSHQPLKLTDPLPCLKIFTPLDITSTTSLLPAATPTSPLIQQHDITFSSPQRLLTAKATLTVNTTNHTVTSLSLTSLSPWAASELGSHILALKTSPTSSKDISHLSQAISTYWTLASTRATCWTTLTNSYNHLLPKHAETKSPPSFKSQQATTTSHKAAATTSEASEDDEVSAISFTNTSSASTEKSPLRRDLLTHLSRSSLLFLNKEESVELLIAWRIIFDWTGEAQSEVSATVTLPSIWTNKDTRSSLKKIPDVFDKLVVEKGVLGASRAVLGLLFR